MRRLLFFSTLILFLSACTTPPPLPPIPDGEQELTGLLMRTSISVSRRGTHVFTVDSTPLYYAESSAVNLGAYEDRPVTVRGVVERNIDPTDLPVLLISDAIIETVDTTRRSIPSLNVVLHVPPSWKQYGKKENVLFEYDGHEVLTVFSSKDPLPAGTPLSVAGSRGVRNTDDVSGGQTIVIDRLDHRLYLQFTPPQDAESLTELRTAFLQLLTTLSFIEEGDSGSGATTSGSGGTAVGLPCGGAAGILCPKGHYCSITDTENNIGRCIEL